VFNTDNSYKEVPMLLKSVEKSPGKGMEESASVYGGFKQFRTGGGLA